MAILGITAVRRKRKTKQAIVVPEADDLAVRIQQAYATEPWLKELRQQQDLRSRDGFWVRGTQIFVPSSLREEICHLAHDHPSAGHFGQAKTMDLVQRYYWWPGMRREVEQYVNTCLVCQ